MKSPYKGFTRIFKAAGFSWKGIIATWQNEAAFKQEIVLFTVLVPLAFWIGETSLEVIALIVVLLLVLLVEILNSAIESVVDRTGAEYHELSGRAKDQASAAVLLAFVIAILVWGGFIFSKLSRLVA